MDRFFPARPGSTPTIYAFSINDPNHAGLVKIGYTEGDAKARIAQQFPGGFDGYTIELVKPAVRPDGTSFTDHDVHRHLKARGYVNTTHEFFRCSVDAVKAAILAVREQTENVQERTQNFAMRPEQREAVEKTAAYFRSACEEQQGSTPHFLWNCKMRFGKTFGSYQLAKEMGLLK